MTLTERIDTLMKLGDHLKKGDEYLDALIHRSQFHNAWFTIENQQRAINAIAQQFLSAEQIDKWINAYQIPAENETQTVGIVMAGNIPLVGFHDWLTVFVAGHKAQIKLSDKDPYLMPHLLKIATDIHPEVAEYYEIVPQLKGFDAVIATGSNNAARYFEAYFSKHPHIIRKNRNGVAVLTGEEKQEDLLELGKDVFEYFGLGCRNVSKLFVPMGYNFDPLLEALHEYRDIVLNTKYKNNFDYNYALYILNKEKFKANGCILLREDTAIQSRIASLHYEYYENLDAVKPILTAKDDEIQCIIAADGLIDELSTFSFGKAQQPQLWDYADGEDTMAFLLSL